MKYCTNEQGLCDEEECTCNRVEGNNLEEQACIAIAMAREVRKNNEKAIEILKNLTI